MLDNEELTDNLICALREERLDTVRELIDKNGVVYSKEGYALLFLDAANNKHTLINELLLSLNNKYNERLHFAVRDGDMEIVKMLLDKGANIDAKDECGRSPLHTAIEYNEMEIMELLFNRGASVNDGNPDGMALLHIAAEKGYVHLKHGAYVDSAYSKRDTPTDGYTPLCFAADNGNEEIIRLLLNQGANINVRAKHGVSLLHIAVKRENLKIVELLLKHGADIDCTINLGPKRGYTPLCFAVDTGNEEMIKFLLSHGADINTTANNGVFPLHVAVGEKKKSVAERRQ